MATCLLAFLAFQGVAPLPAPVDLSERLQRISVPIRDAGVYDVDSRTLRPPEVLAATSRDVIYDNTCQPTYYFTFDPGDIWLDEGCVPTPSAPNAFPGCRTSYDVNAFRIGYCTLNTNPVAEITVFNHYDPLCSPTVIGESPATRLVLDGLPGSPVEGELTCWDLVIDLGTRSFVLEGDGDGTYQGSHSYFGFAVGFPSSSPSLWDGMMVAGRLPACSWWAGTVWNPDGQENPPDGTGRCTDLGSLNWFASDGSGHWCLITGQEPFSWFLELHSDDACPPEPGQITCTGLAAQCPCGNGGYVDTGCDNPAGTGGARLRVLDYTPDAVGGGTVFLQGSNFPFDSTPAVVVIRAASGEVPPVAFGDGLRCVGLPGLTRVGAALAVNGMSAHPLSHGAGAGTFHYQLWYRSLPATFCTPAGFNLSNAYQLAW